MLELHVPNPDVTSGTIPVTWCLSKEDLEAIKKYREEYGGSDPTVLILVAPVDNYHSNKEQRYVVRLSDMMAYVSFKYPGKNRIFAMVCSQRTFGAYKERFLGRGWDGYYVTLLNYKGDDYAAYYLNSREGQPKGEKILMDRPLEVDVPADCFAKEPHELEKAWASWLLPSSFTDQCAFRRRRFFYPIQAVIFVLNMFLRFLILMLALSLGARSLTLKYLRHPLTYGMWASWEMFSEGILFCRKESGDDPRTAWEVVKYVAYHCWPLPFSPLSLGTIAALGYLSGWAVLMKAFLYLSGVLTAILLVIAFGLFSRYFRAWYSKQATTELQEIEAELICTGEPRMSPPARRSVKLYYMAVKSKVCKPYAG